MSEEEGKEIVLFEVVGVFECYSVGTAASPVELSHLKRHSC